MLKLNVGFTKKVGEANYGSRGAAVNLELELDSGLVGDADRLKDRIRQLFLLAKASVDEELAAQAGVGSGHAASNGTATVATGNGYGHTNGNGANGHRASTKQLDYASQLAGQIRGLGVRRLEALAQKMFDKPLANLSSLDASGLIDALRDIKAGKIDLEAALNGAAQ